MPVTLRRHGPDGGGPGHRGGCDGGRGRGGQGGPLPCRERNPMLASNSRSSALATSISPLPRTPAPSAAVPPPPPAVAGPQYATAVVQVQDWMAGCRVTFCRVASTLRRASRRHFLSTQRIAPLPSPVALSIAVNIALPSRRPSPPSLDDCFFFIAIAVGCRHRYRNGRQRRENNQLMSNGNGNGRRDSDATATAIECATEMQW